jgi:hypothetical protein
MGMISTTMVSSIAQKLDGLDLARRQRVLDEVMTPQPEPTGFVLVALSRMELPSVAFSNGVAGRRH